MAKFRWGNEGGSGFHIGESSLHGGVGWMRPQDAAAREISLRKEQEELTARMQYHVEYPFGRVDPDQHPAGLRVPGIRVKVESFALKSAALYHTVAALRPGSRALCISQERSADMGLEQFLAHTGVSVQRLDRIPISRSSRA